MTDHTHEEETPAPTPRPEYYTVEIVHNSGNVTRHQHVVNYNLEVPIATYFFFVRPPEHQFTTIVTQWLHAPTLNRVIITPEQ